MSDQINLILIQIKLLNENRPADPRDLGLHQEILANSGLQIAEIFRSHGIEPAGWRAEEILKELKAV